MTATYAHGENGLAGAEFPEPALQGGGRFGIGGQDGDDRRVIGSLRRRLGLLLDAEASQRGVAAGVDVVGPSVDSPPRRVLGVPNDPELGGQDHLVAAVGDRPRHSLIADCNVI